MYYIKFQGSMQRHSNSNSFNLLIAGGRDFSNYELLARRCAAYIAENCGVRELVVISGRASGADLLGEQFAREYQLRCRFFLAQWEKFGRAAGPMRNRQMAEVADGAVVFWDGRSRGTRSMIGYLRQMGVPHVVVPY